jgi:acyl carrier protein
MNANDFLVSVILELKDIDEADLTPDMTLEQLALDSLDYVEIQVGIKKNFGVEILPELFTSGGVKTLGELVLHIEKNQSENTGALNI